MDDRITLRFARIEDAPVVLRFVRALARCVRSEERVSATLDDMRTWMFERGAAEALLAEDPHGGAVGCAVFFPKYSTWAGAPGLYLEDLYVEEGWRSRGVGKMLMERLASLCLERGWTHMGWTCRSWNEPALAFYRRLGARPDADGVLLELDGEGVAALAGGAAHEGKVR